MSRGVEASTDAGVERCVRASWVLRARGGVDGRRQSERASALASALVEEKKNPKHPGPANGVFSP